MPVEFAVDQTGTFVHAKATGTLTEEDLQIYEKSTLEDERIAIGFWELFDASELIESNLNTRGLKRIAQMVRSNPKRNEASNLAIVVSKASTFDDARVFERIVSKFQNVIVFNSVNTARMWLGFPNEMT
ncbi:MAG: hypothetical protein QNI92_04240 [Desulfobacterales bacterium]|nr:hypothetical protein [Desulfobacterales bacterium]MDJ0914099.1 hypothetical protein [Desulfobacterales bacterium]